MILRERAFTAAGDNGAIYSPFTAARFTRELRERERERGGGGKNPDARLPSCALLSVSRRKPVIIKQPRIATVVDADFDRLIFGAVKVDAAGDRSICRTRGRDREIIGGYGARFAGGLKADMDRRELSRTV